MTNLNNLRDVKAYGPQGTPRPHVDMAALGDLFAVFVHVTAPPLLALRELRVRSPWAPLVLVVPTLNAHGTMDTTRWIQATGAREVTPSHEFADWRRNLIRDSNVADGFVTLFRLLRPDTNGSVLTRIRTLVDEGSDGRGFQEAVDGLGCSLRSVESQFKRARLRPPSHYHLFGGLARTFSSLANDSTMRIADAVASSPYEDRTSMARAVRDRLGTTLDHGRHRIPWEWIAHQMGLYGAITE